MNSCSCSFVIFFMLVSKEYIQQSIQSVVNKGKKETGICG